MGYAGRCSSARGPRAKEPCPVIGEPTVCGDPALCLRGRLRGECRLSASRRRRTGGRRRHAAGRLLDDTGLYTRESTDTTGRIAWP